MLNINELVEQRRAIGMKCDKQDEIADLLALAHLSPGNTFTTPDKTSTGYI